MRFETTKGEFIVEVDRAWAPHGADRFYNLVRNGYYDGVYFYRVMAGFMAQFGMHGESRRCRSGGPARISRTIPWRCPTLAGR